MDKNLKLYYFFYQLWSYTEKDITFLPIHTFGSQNDKFFLIITYRYSVLMKICKKLLFFQKCFIPFSSYSFILFFYYNNTFKVFTIHTRKINIILKKKNIQWRIYNYHLPIRHFCSNKRDENFI